MRSLCILVVPRTKTSVDCVVVGGYIRVDRDICTASDALLRRTMQFVVIAKIQFLSALAGLVAAVLIARSGYGYWALVLRPVVSAAGIAAGAWLACSWRPGRPVFDAEVKSMVHFGMHVLSFSIISSMIRVADRIALGLVYAPRDVGYFQNAQNMYENAFLAPVDQLHGVGSAGLSKLRSNPAALQQKYEATLSAMAFFVMPTAAILSVTGKDVTVMLLGEAWRNSGLLLSIMALRGVGSSLKCHRAGCMFPAVGRTAGKIGGL